MTDGRHSFITLGAPKPDERKSSAAKKGWQTRHARQRMLADAQDYAEASALKNNNVTLQEAEKVYQPKRSWWARFCDWLDRG